MNQNQELELSFVRIYDLLSESCCSHVMKIYSATSVFKYLSSLIFETMFGHSSY